MFNQLPKGRNTSPVGGKVIKISSSSEESVLSKQGLGKKPDKSQERRQSNSDGFSTSELEMILGVLSNLPQALALFNKNQLVYWNQTFANMSPGLGGFLEKSRTQQEVWLFMAGFMAEAFDDHEAWLKDFLLEVDAPSRKSEQQLVDGRWFEVSKTILNEKTVFFTWEDITQHRYNEEVLLIKNQELGHSQSVIQDQNRKIQINNQMISRANKQMHEDLALAEGFQKSLFPNITPPDYLRLAYIFKPFGEVSGDFYDWEHGKDKHFNLFVGDAIGHGIAAAFITMMASIGLDTVDQNARTDQKMIQLNQLLTQRDRGDKYLTGILMRISPDGLMKTTNAGHPSLLIIPADESAPMPLKKGGLPLGMMQGADEMYEEETRQLTAGDRVLVFTDGLIEWANTKGEQYGLEQMLHYFQQTTLPLDELLEGLLQQVQAFAGEAPCLDDYTLFLLEYQGLG